MATSRKPVITAEALAETVTEEAPTTSAAAIAAELAPVLRGVEAKFDACRIAYAGVSAGVKPQDIADATTRVIAEAMAENVTAKNRAAYITAISKVSQKDGGASITRVAIVQRKDAWKDLVDSGITPTPAGVEASIKVTQTGGTSDLRKALIASAKKVPTANRQAWYIAESAKRLVALKDTKAAAKAEAAAGQSADNKSDQPTEEVVIESVESFTEYVRAFVAAPHTDEDKATLSALFTEVLAAL